MKYKDREGNIKGNTSKQDHFLALLYGTSWGRSLIRFLIQPNVSIAVGKLLNSSVSRLFVPFFVKANEIDLSLCEKQTFRSYNDFFKRRFKQGAREICTDRHALISPCDGKLSVYPIHENSQFQIKHTMYTVKDLLRDAELAERFCGGYAWIFRLSVEDYHRYCYVADGVKTKNVKIPGVYHTVNPVANDTYPIYKENTREYSLLHTEEFGAILMMEVGALLVGKIENLHGAGRVRRGEEKGNFAFGGSTIVLLTEKDRVKPDHVFLHHTQRCYETIVRQGEHIGEQIQNAISTCEM